MDKLELKIPPVLIFIFCCGLIYLCAGSTFLSIPLPIPWLIFTFCFVGSGYFGLSGIYEFKKAKTTVNPVDVKKASTVVDSGVYRVSRNPMYLALLFLVFGLGYLQENVLCLSVSIIFVLYMNRFQILPEEKHLQEKFSQSYINYKNRVRRWL